MADWTNIPDATFDPDRPVLGSTHLAIVKNFEALAEAATGAPRIVADTFSGAVAGDSVLFAAMGTNVVFLVTGPTTTVTVPGSRFRAITSGTVRVFFEYALTAGGNLVSVTVRKNGASVFSVSKVTGGYTSHSVDVSYVAGDVITVDPSGGTSGGSDPIFSTIGVRNVQYRTNTTRLLGGT